ncbi:hypothetical protein JL475_11535 [Streptomyces sp. M2CJ-2]|uniref:hypothetical protein n=1 Tax=Streptomyces sp. M2CJ-2 TaxID=2803948 RepID=UPI00192409EF|nr:hypothetical protein [Streptomyces sp. M2CJ-2]MBL3666613.1 hypothetical protein [Streptomyces sp. M2CJ-2]
MLAEGLVAVAAAGGTAVVQAVGTDLWVAVRGRVARRLGRGSAEREQAVLERLDRTAGELEQGEAGESQRARLEASWQARFEDFIDELPAEEQSEAAEWLRGITSLGSLAQSGATAGSNGLAVGGELHVNADNGSLAGGVLNIDGGVTLGNPHRPAANTD